jgi:radical SAM superfamily enzyme YgiQ (UPF0313 family)
LKVWLADLTYTQQTIASDVVPAAVGMIGEFVRANMAEPPEIRIFKFPEDLAAALDRERPDVLGVSNYVWNGALASAFCRRVKEAWPDTVTVMGGPNFATVPEEQEAFLRGHPWIDYYVMKEGEIAFLRLLQHLKDESEELPNVARLDRAGRFVPAARVERVMDLTTIPSPYLSGGMDEFLDGRLLPVIQTNRGCPFTCTFCTEGQTFWNKVRTKPAETIRGELRHIAERMGHLPADRKRWDLLIADSNFAMFAEDLETCRVIAAEQRAHGYPRYVNVATGKNKKERVLEAARLLNGAMKLSGSVQSLDETVQANIKRKNISAGQIVEMALQAAEIGTNTYSEVILGLPGDSRDAHFRTLETLVESGFNTISMYQLMILPGTELGEAATKRKYGMVTKFRVLPRCFGVYDILGAPTSVAEIEEICVASDTLPYADYLQCRRMNFIVNVFYNDGVFSELIKLLTVAGLPRWGWLLDMFESSYSADFDAMAREFVEETEAELWESRAELEAFTARPEIVERYVAGEMGNNLIFKFKALSMTSRFAAVCAVAEGSIRSYLAREAPERPELVEIAEDIIAFKRMQIEELFNDGTARQRTLRYDVSRFSAVPNVADAIDIRTLRFDEPRLFEFHNTDEQRAMIESYINLFGRDVPGLTRILSRVFLKQLLRHPTEALRMTA